MGAAHCLKTGFGKSGRYLILFLRIEKLVEVERFARFHGQGQMTINGAGGEAALAGDLFDRFPRAESFQRLPGRGPKLAGRWAGAAKESSAKIWRGFVCRCAAISPRNSFPNSVSFRSPTPLMRANSLSLPG